MPETVKLAHWLLGLAGAVCGAAIGYGGFFLLARVNIYGLVLPGALTGLGCGVLLRTKSNLLGIACCVLAVLLGIFTEWRSAPFIVDSSFTYFIKHLNELGALTLISIVAGGFFGFWFGRGRTGGVWPRRKKTVQ